MAELRLSKGMIAAIVAVVAVVIVLMMVALSYNGMISKQQGVENAWGNIEARYQRRVELIPQLQSAMNLSIEFQASLYTNITEARTRWLSSIGNIPAQLNATEVMDRNLAVLVATYENYPQLDLGVIQSFVAELSSTQGMIDAARIFYNDAVREYNTAIKKFPNMMFAGAFGFEEAVYYSQGM
ncbi:MAG TPA: LemA family protein [Methanomassiliicoccales archaeon]|nr:LemA family protein [Methanomassiliicoccales archaeon]HNX47224.1 LemA family protein [Methanomassiliicoccales archaeon]HPR97956.1 LemA family protein [Methanomassiliicoccales archaeon]